MTVPYCIISDTHLHGWTAFAKRDPDGVNSRLKQIVAAHYEAAMRLGAAGGSMLFNAGDIFHVRGNTAPSVLNPAMDLYRNLAATMSVYAIPGNHDLEGNESARVSNAVTALADVGVNVAHEPTVHRIGVDTAVAMFPWFSTPEKLLMQMARIRNDNAGIKFLDAIIHAPIDKVLPHLPDHGLSADSLADLGYTRVFSGHYHHHKEMGRGVYSIGALTHQTFGDIESKAGYLLVYPDRVEHFETEAPKFTDITGEEDVPTLHAKVKGNFVRVRLEISTDSELEEMRTELMGLGAAGVVIMPIKKVAVTRTGAAASGSSIENSIDAFAKKKGFAPEVHTACLDILSEARASE